MPYIFHKMPYLFFRAPQPSKKTAYTAQFKRRKTHENIRRKKHMVTYSPPKRHAFFITPGQGKKKWDTAVSQSC